MGIGLHLKYLLCVSEFNENPTRGSRVVRCR